MNMSESQIQLIRQFILVWIVCVFMTPFVHAQVDTTEIKGLDRIAAGKDSLLAEARKATSVITPDELSDRINSGDTITIVDICTFPEYEQGHIKGAVWMPRGKLEFYAAAGMLGGVDNELVLYCKKDARAAFACQTLQNMGFENVKNLQGGLKGWAEAGYSIYNQHGELTVKEYGKKEKDD